MIKKKHVIFEWKKFKQNLNSSGVLILKKPVLKNEHAGSKKIKMQRIK